jgi:hypothetical protein
VASVESRLSALGKDLAVLESSLLERDDLVTTLAETVESLQLQLQQLQQQRRQWGATVGPDPVAAASVSGLASGASMEELGR